METVHFESLSEVSVVTFYDGRPLNLNKTVRECEISEAIINRFGNSDINRQFLQEGVECEMLKPGANEWRKGKVRLVLEFTPESHEVPLQLSRDLQESQESIISPLDELRNASTNA
jgi:KGK domain